MSTQPRRRVARSIPDIYLLEPKKAQELLSTVTRPTIFETDKTFPQTLLEYGTTPQLGSKFTYTFFKALVLSGDDGAWEAVKTSDNHIILCGYTSSIPHGTRPLLFIKLNEAGDILWAKTVSGGGSEFIRFIEPHPSGGYICGGETTSSSAGGVDFLLLKINQDCEPEWARVIGGSLNDNGRKAMVTSDGGIIMQGFTFSYGSPTPQLLVVKFSSDLTLEWAKVYNFQNGTRFWDMCRLHTGDYAIFGRDEFTELPERTSILLTIDENGEIVGATRLIGNDWLIGMSVLETRDNKILLGIESLSFDAVGVACLFVKLEPDGELIIAKQYDSTGSDYPLQKWLLDDGSIISCGMTTYGSAGALRGLVLKVDKNLDLEFAKYFAGIEDYYFYEELRRIFPLDNGDFFTVGRTYRFRTGSEDIIFARLSRNGTIPFCPYIDDIPMIEYEVYPEIQTPPISVIDVTDQIQVSSPTYTVQTQTLNLTTACILLGWDAFMDEIF